MPSGETLTLGPGSGVSQRRVTRACQHSEGLICSAAGRWGRDQRRAEVIRGEAGQLGTRRPRAGSGEQQSYGRAVAWVSAVGTPATAGLSKPRPWLRRAESRGAQVRGRGLRALPRSGSPHARPPTPEPAPGLVLRRRRASGHRPLCPSQPRAPVAGLSRASLGPGAWPRPLRTADSRPPTRLRKRASPESHSFVTPSLWGSLAEPPGKAAAVPTGAWATPPGPQWRHPAPSRLRLRGFQSPPPPPPTRANVSQSTRGSRNTPFTGTHDQLRASR